ncbi:MAG: RagB/SusD family nutrient uptake outer membrane protein [Bacteroidetes bacterium]|jgi:hypothetical protein|nr:RagB/SusD family nutrient uptake outer membrane protein [Bacteroidota bacterium]
MKINNKILIPVVLIAMLLFSCSSEEYLDLKPVKGSSSAIQFGSEQGAETALVGCYDIMAKDGRYFFWLFWMDGFQYTKSGMFIGFDDPGAVITQNGSYPYPIANGRDLSHQHWKDCYLEIGKLNYFLANVVNTPFTNPDRLPEAMAEARCMRAFNYFHLVQMFKRVPLVLSPSDPDYPSQVEPEETYAQIMSDLRYAFNNLKYRDEALATPHLPTNESGSPEYARMTKGTAAALLSKVFLTSEGGHNPFYNPDSAAYYADLVINKGGYSLEPNFDDLWGIANTVPSDEMIWQVPVSSEPPNSGATISSWGRPGQNWFRPQKFILELYRDSIIYNDITNDESEVVKRIPIDTFFVDTRKSATMNVKDTIKYGAIYDEKYAEGAQSTHTDNPKIYILRLADIILIKAEALNQANYSAHKQEIVDLINQIRDRAFIVNSEDHPEMTPDIYRLKAEDVSSQEEMALIIETERRTELFFECHLWFDMKRTGRFVDFYFDGDQSKKHLEYMPISQRELKLNPNLEQIEGYSE